MFQAFVPHCSTLKYETDKSSQNLSKKPPLYAACGPGSIVGITTGYRLDGLGIESQWGGEIFRTCPDRPWSPPSLLYSGYRVFPVVKQQPGRDADPSPPSSAIGHERVELYLYSPYGPYGLYRASVPVQGHMLPFTTLFYAAYNPKSQNI
jgi:hypothetical protein